MVDIHAVYFNSPDHKAFHAEQLQAPTSPQYGHTRVAEEPQEPDIQEFHKRFWWLHVPQCPLYTSQSLLGLHGLQSRARCSLASGPFITQKQVCELIVGNWKTIEFFAFICASMLRTHTCLSAFMYSNSVYSL